MRVIIIEDEIPAAAKLSKMLKKINDEVEIVAKLDSVESSVKYLQTATAVDLIFMDIQLADGLSFSIFEQIKITTPVIFTTAFDKYTLKAFKVNSIDYLLKPIDDMELRQALDKFSSLHKKINDSLSEKIFGLMNDLNITKYKERLLIKRGQQLSYIKTENIAYCYADGKLCYAVDRSNNKFLLEDNLINLEEKLNPDNFYRINRNMLVNISAIQKIYTWLGGRLKVELAIPANTETVVSRERVVGFKEWLGGK